MGESAKHTISVRVGHKLGTSDHKSHPAFLGDPDRPYMVSWSVQYKTFELALPRPNAGIDSVSRTCPICDKELVFFVMSRRTELKYKVVGAALVLVGAALFVDMVFGPRVLVSFSDIYALLFLALSDNVQGLRTGPHIPSLPLLPSICHLC